MTKKEIRIFCSPTLLIGILFIILLSWGLLIFFLAYEPSRVGLLSSIPCFIILVLILGVCPIFIILASMRCYFSIITIDETGISRAFLGKFFKLKMAWNEIADIRYYTTLIGYFVFSKTKYLCEIPSSKWYRIKDTVFFTVSKKRYNVIKQYLQQPIFGIPYYVKADLEKEKKKK